MSAGNYDTPSISTLITQDTMVSGDSFGAHLAWLSGWHASALVNNYHTHLTAHSQDQSLSVGVHSDSPA